MLATGGQLAQQLGLLGRLAVGVEGLETSSPQISFTDSEGAARQIQAELIVGAAGPAAAAVGNADAHALGLRVRALPLTAERIAATAASTACSARSARPRLVCSTVPVRLNTGRRLDWASRASRWNAAKANRPASPLASPALRASASTARTAPTTAGRPNRSIAPAASCEHSTSSTDGSFRNAAGSIFGMLFLVASLAIAQ